MANKAIKYRISPATEQSVMFAKTFGCCRKVYNLMLADKIESYKAAGKFAAVTPAKYKEDYPYLKEVDSLALANKQMDLQTAEITNQYDVVCVESLNMKSMSNRSLCLTKVLVTAKLLLITDVVCSYLCLNTSYSTEISIL